MANEQWLLDVNMECCLQQTVKRIEGDKMYRFGSVWEPEKMFC